MKFIETAFDKETYRLDLTYTHKEMSEITIVISDLETDVTYFLWKTILHPQNSIWICPINGELTRILKNSKTFPGFACKIYVDNRLEQVEEIRTNLIPYKYKPFFTDRTDPVGNSYVDFFYGSLCDGIDFSGTVIDAGANVGFFTWLAKERNANKVYSIEPDVNAFFYLDRNFRNDSSITLIQKALTTDVNGTIFYYCKDSTVANSQYKVVENYIEDFVPTINLDYILNIENEINLVKLDIEGSEFDVMENLELKHFQKINQFFIEFHRDSIPIKNILIQNGYKVEYKNSNENSSVGFIYAYKI